jgi:hypothetical protein
MEMVGSCHSSCRAALTAKVVGEEYGKKSGWFFWPFDFDPTWLVECDSFKDINKSK